MDSVSFVLHRKAGELSAKPTEGASVSRTCDGPTPPPSLRFAQRHLPRYAVEDIGSYLRT